LGHDDRKPDAYVIRQYCTKEKEKRGRLHV